MARASSPCADGYDRIRLPPAFSPRRRERRKKESPAARPAALARSPPTDAHTAVGKSEDRSIERAKVVLGHRLINGRSRPLHLASGALEYRARKGGGAAHKKRLLSGLS
jgi:hypothetical protein